MNKIIFKWSMLALLFVSLMQVSCSKEEQLTNEELESYAEEVIFRTQESVNMGTFGCYDLVFPVTVLFPDRTTTEVSSYEEMHSTIVQWRRSNPRVKARPQLQLPYEVTDEDGQIYLIDSFAKQLELRKACAKTFFDNNGPKGHKDRPKQCFIVVFPLTIHYPDGTTLLVENRMEFQSALREWVEANPNANGRPIVGLPFTVLLRNGNKVLIETRDELRRLRASCK